MKYSPKPWGREAGVLTVALFAVSLVSYVFSNLGFAAPLPLQLVSLVTLCAAVYILVRFKFTSTTYMVRQRDGVRDDVYSSPENNLDFCVSRGQGRRVETLECVLDLGCLVDALDFNGDVARSLREKYKNIKIYNYTASLMPRRRLGLVFDDEGDVNCVIIEPDESFDRFLKEISKENKEK